MLRLIWWFVSSVIIGKKAWPRADCLCSSSNPFRRFRYKAPYCDLGLCIDCCATRCRCLSDKALAAREMRRELAP